MKYRNVKTRRAKRYIWKHTYHPDWLNGGREVSIAAAWQIIEDGQRRAKRRRVREARGR